VLTKTSELAIFTLIYLAREKQAEPQSPKVLAKHLSCSSTYLAKIISSLARSGLVETVKGKRGGVRLTKDIQEITLKSIVESSQRVVSPDFCGEEPGGMERACGFHLAMDELHVAISSILEKWTLADLMSSPTGDSEEMIFNQCKISYKKVTTKEECL
jgi:Rrf2 family protein